VFLLLFVAVAAACSTFFARLVLPAVRPDARVAGFVRQAILVVPAVVADAAGEFLIALAVGAVLVVASAFGIFMQVQEALDEIWEIPERRRGGVWKTIVLRLHALVIVAALAVLAMISLVVADAAGLRAGIIVNILALVLFLTLTYRILPQTDVGWKSSALGAAITGIVLLLGEAAISIYFTHARPASNYGSVGAFVLVLLWIYYSAQLLLFGAELTRTVETSLEKR